MAIIRLLDQATVNKIAAGEVVERPASVVKEMVENSIDAGATDITVEIQEGGISLIRIVDNGSGIEKDQVRTAFLRHATSKIRSVEDLQETLTLGFRGEALASVAAVSRVEMTTRTQKDETGVHYVIEGGVEYDNSEIACPVGTTIKVENLFFNTPPRKKFLKKPASEAAAITDLMQKMILGHPEVSFRYLNGKKEPTLFSAGQNKLRNSIFAVYGKEVLDKMIPVDAEVALSDSASMRVKGYISRPQNMRANRSYETLFINGRYVKSALLERALDEAYKDYVVPGTFPIAVLHLEMDPSCLDVNVHPTKMEVRFMEEERTRLGFYEAIYKALNDENLIARVGSFYKETGEIVLRGAQSKDVNNTLSGDTTENPIRGRYQTNGEKTIGSFIPEKKPFDPWHKDEKKETASPYLSGIKTRITEEELRQRPETVPQGAKRSSDYTGEWSGQKKEFRSDKIAVPILEEEPQVATTEKLPEAGQKADGNSKQGNTLQKASFFMEEAEPYAVEPERLNKQGTPVVASPYAGDQVESLVPEEKVSETDNQNRPKELRLIGQAFKTYWFAEEKDVLYVVDQHAAHERVLYDRYRALLNAGNIDTQNLLEPVVCSVNPKAVARLDEFTPVLTKLGYEIEAFGEDAVIVRGVPFLFKGPLSAEDMALVIDMCYNGQIDTARDLLIDRIATMSCKAAVKGNDALSFEEAESLLQQLFASNNPYNCPHGRPTIISLTKYQIEKRFLRV